jgi:hypothetical protein
MCWDQKRFKAKALMVIMKMKNLSVARVWYTWSAFVDDNKKSGTLLPMSWSLLPSQKHVMALTSRPYQHDEYYAASC